VRSTGREGKPWKAGKTFRLTGKEVPGTVKSCNVLLFYPAAEKILNKNKIESIIKPRGFYGKD